MGEWSIASRGADGNGQDNFGGISGCDRSGHDSLSQRLGYFSRFFGISMGENDEELLAAIATHASMRGR